jgi:hypothetical protein
MGVVGLAGLRRILGPRLLRLESDVELALEFIWFDAIFRYKVK